jgi:hypothetical protein
MGAILRHLDIEVNVLLLSVSTETRMRKTGAFSARCSVAPEPLWQLGRGKLVDRICAAQVAHRHARSMS